MRARAKRLIEEARKKRSVARKRLLFATKLAQKASGRTEGELLMVEFNDKTDLDQEIDATTDALGLPEDYQERKSFYAHLFEGYSVVLQQGEWSDNKPNIMLKAQKIAGLRRRAEAIEAELMRRVQGPGSEPLRLRARALVHMARTYDNSLEEFLEMACSADFGFYIADMNERRCVWQKGQ